MWRSQILVKSESQFDSGTGLKLTRSEAGKLGATKSNELRKQRALERELAYEQQPKQCAYCFSSIKFKYRENNYCNSSCAAIANNKKRALVHREITCNRCSQLWVPPNGQMNLKTCPGCRQPAAKNIEWEEVKHSQTRRRRLLKERPHQCEMCTNTTWLGKPIPLDVDHINGLSTDNSKENLRLICPNCHATTPTFKGRNRGNGRVQRRQRYHEGKSF